MSDAAQSSTLPARSGCLLKKGELNRWGKESEWNTLVSGKILTYYKNLRNNFFVMRGVDGSMIPLTVLESMTGILSRYTSYILYNKLHNSFQKPRQTEKKEGGKYRKIHKISPAAYMLQRPFLRDPFLEGLIFGGAYLWREICVSKSSGLPLQLEGNLPFLLCFTLYLRAISEYKPPGGLLWRGDLTDGFLLYKFGGLIFGGAYKWRGLFSEFYGMWKMHFSQAVMCWQACTCYH